MFKQSKLTLRVVVVSGLMLAVAHWPTASGQPVQYTVTDLGAPIGGTSLGSALNNVGQVTGKTGEEGAGGLGAQAFRFDPDGRMIILNDGPFPQSGGLVINDLGQVAGLVCVTEGLPCDFYIFRYTDGVGLELLGVLGDGDSAHPSAINELGDVVGESHFDPSAAVHAFLFTDEEGMIDLGTLPSDANISSEATDVNNARQVVGRSFMGPSPGGGLRAFLWEDGVMQDLGTFGGSQSGAAGINEAGQIVGSADLPDHTDHAFRHTPGVGMEDLNPPFATSSRGLLINESGTIAGTFRNDDGDSTFLFSDELGFFDIGVFEPAENSILVEPTDMNSSGQIVGRALNIPSDDLPLLWHQFFWSPETGLVDLSTVIETGPRDVVLSEAVAIDDSGRILVNGEIDGESRALLLTPIAGPQTIIPIAQERFINTLVSFRRCGKLSDSDEAEGFDPFDSFLETAQNCDGPYGHVAAQQQSQIDAASMTASGSVFTKDTGGDGNSTLVLSGTSFFAVTFELAEASQFALAGAINATAHIPDAGVETDAELTLTGPGDGTIFTHLVSAGTGGMIEEQGVLAPGVYTLLAIATLSIDGIAPDFAVGEASFEFTFTVEQVAVSPGDFDGDGDVDMDDYLAFRDCFTGSGGGPVVGLCIPGDFDGDGDIDFEDLAAFRDAYTGRSR